MSKKTLFRKLELAIFLLIFLTFSHSSYRFVQARNAPAKSAPTIQTLNSAGIAHDDELVSKEIGCGATPIKFDTKATRIRLTGPLCSAHKLMDPSELRKIEGRIQNLSMSYSATVLFDFESAQFSSDYIPLKEGENKIAIRLDFPGRKPASKQTSWSTEVDVSRK